MKHDYLLMKHSLTNQEYIDMMLEESAGLDENTIDQLEQEKKDFIISHPDDLDWPGDCPQCKKHMLTTVFPRDLVYSYCPDCKLFVGLGTFITWHPPENDEEWDEGVKMIGYFNRLTQYKNPADTIYDTIEKTVDESIF